MFLKNSSKDALKDVTFPIEDDDSIEDPESFSVEFTPLNPNDMFDKGMNIIKVIIEDNDGM